MNREELAEKLDREIDGFIERNTLSEPAPLDVPFQVPAELRLLPHLPSEEFRARLKEELLEQAESLRSSRVYASSEILPSLNQPSVPSFSTRQIAVLPADPRSLVFSFLSHAAVVALIASGIWVGHVTLVEKRTLLSELTYTPLPAAKAEDGVATANRNAASATVRGTRAERSSALKRRSFSSSGATHSAAATANGSAITVSARCTARSSKSFMSDKISPALPVALVTTAVVSRERSLRARRSK